MKKSSIAALLVVGFPVAACWSSRALAGVEIADARDTLDRAVLGTDGVLSLAVPAKRITDMSDDDARLRTFRREADRADAWHDFARCVAHKE